MCLSIYVQGCASAEEFMEKLPLYDGDLAKERLEAENSGEVRSFAIVCFFNLMILSRL